MVKIWFFLKYSLVGMSDRQREVDTVFEYVEEGASLSFSGLTVVFIGIPTYTHEENTVIFAKLFVFELAIP